MVKLSREAFEMKQEAFTMSLLLDYYGSLLTEKQKTYFDLYYNQDLSLSEIAQQEGISRQGVHDTITRAETLLRDLENEIRDAARQLSDSADPSVQSCAQRILAAAASVKEEPYGI